MSDDVVVAAVKVESTSDDSVSAEIKPEHVVDDKRHSKELRQKRFTCNTTDHRAHYNQHIARCCRGNVKQPITVEHSDKHISVGSVKRHSKKAVSSDVMIPCPCCEEKFDTAAKLDGHLRDDHHVTQEITSCHFCSFRFVFTAYFIFYC